MSRKWSFKSLGMKENKTTHNTQDLENSSILKYFDCSQEHVCYYTLSTIDIWNSKDLPSND